MGWFKALSIWIRIALVVVAVVVIYFVATSSLHGIRDAIFGNPDVKRAQADTVVATQQTKAESNIADNTIQTVRERDVYREHETEVVHEAQEKVHAADKGQQMDQDIDAAVAAGLCSLHDSLCRGPKPAPLQPVR